MIVSRSLTLRLVVHLLLGLSLAYAATYLAFLLLSIAGLWQGNTVYWDDLALFHAREMVIESIVRAPDGEIRIEPTNALRGEMTNTPTLQFAVFVPKVGSPLPGSSPSLATALANVGPIKTRGGLDFTINGDEMERLQGDFSEETTPYGSFNIAVYGYRFRWRDVVYTLYVHFTRDFWFFAPVWAIALSICWVSLRSGLSPLRAAAFEAERIDINSLDQRISPDAMPCELMPLVKTINDALARLDAGAAQQRRFVANSAHELRTPVTILKSRIDAMERSSTKSELSRDIKRIQNIVDQLLVTARLSDPCAALDQQIDTIDLLDETVGDYAPLILASKRQIELVAPEDSILVRGDRRALKSVFANLIDNALRAEPSGGVVVVRVKPGTVIEVVDHGEGVAPTDCEMIFEPFWRKSEAATGTGLGLAIAQELVSLHHGTISVAQTPGGGATFQITLQQISKSEFSRNLSATGAPSRGATLDGICAAAQSKAVYTQ